MKYMEIRMFAKESFKVSEEPITVGYFMKEFLAFEGKLLFLYSVKLCLTTSFHPLLK